ncbi:hypothetical protein LXL04_025194 [Taraxacum kok-saghyz]
MEWQQVQRRRKQSVFDRLGRPSSNQQVSPQGDLRRNIFNVFVTNFPQSVDSKELSRLCGIHGTVSDVFVAKNLSKMGKRYAFIRFNHVVDEAKLLLNLCNIWMGSYKLFAARVINDQFRTNYSKKPTQVSPMEGTLHTTTQPGKTFASVVAPKLTSVVVPTPVEVCLARVKHFSYLPIIMDMCKAHGFPDIDIRYVGGLWLSLEFRSVNVCMNFRSNTVTSSWFTQLQNWNRNFVPDQRLAWLDIEGVPLRAWSKTNFHKLALKWGTIVYMDENLGLSLATNRVCIETNRMGIISEDTRIAVDDDRFIVRVREVSGWIPTFNDKTNSPMADEDTPSEPAFDADDLEEVGSVHFIHENDEIHEEPNSDPFDLSDLIRNETEKARAQRMVPPL